MEKFKKHMSSFRLILGGFFLVILAGALLLMTPLASQSGQWTSFLDALFTSTSAVCVTGLIVHDTATYWNMFGQVVIIILIQIGGIGVVTAVVSIARYAGRKIGLMQRSVMQDAISAPQVGGIVRMVGFIIKGTAFFELAGAAVMAPVFIRDFGVLKGIWYAIFHSISAFCNAGFDLIGVRKPFSSLTSYVSDPVINLTIMALIIIGGIGFFTWEDFYKHGLKFHKYRLQTKIVLSVTAVLIIVPAVYFYFGEFTKGAVGTRVLESLFMSVTPRTAGFNTVDLNTMTEAGQLIVIVLMLIGGSPGSTAGGMKITTIATMALSMRSSMLQKRCPTVFGRRLELDVVHIAATIFFMYISLFLLGGIMISRIENLPVLECLYETASALDTVGLTMGITTKLHAASKIILICYMYIGRVGGMTLAFAALRKNRVAAAMPAENIMIG
jgi:trk system potassium uptake protein TrkH